MSKLSRTEIQRFAHQLPRRYPVWTGPECPFWRRGTDGSKKAGIIPSAHLFLGSHGLSPQEKRSFNSAVESSVSHPSPVPMTCSRSLFSARSFHHLLLQRPPAEKLVHLKRFSSGRFGKPGPWPGFPPPVPPPVEVKHMLPGSGSIRFPRPSRKG